MIFTIIIVSAVLGTSVGCLEHGYFKKKRDARFREDIKGCDILHSAWVHIYSKEWRKASTKDRGHLLPEIQEALEILDRLSKQKMQDALGRYNVA